MTGGTTAKSNDQQGVSNCQQKDSQTAADSVQIKFEKFVEGLDAKYHDIPGKLLTLPATIPSSCNDGTVQPCAGAGDSDDTKRNKKNLSLLMAYASSIASLAYNKPGNLVADVPLGLTESLTDGTTVQHFSKEALKKCVVGIAKIRLTKTDVTGTKVDPYVVFTHGTSMVKCNVPEDLFTTTESPYHYLCIRKKSGEENSEVKVHAYILDKDPGNADKEGQTESMNEGVDHEAPEEPAEIKLDFSSTGQRVSTPQLVLTATLDGKTVNVDYTLEALTVDEFIKEPPPKTQDPSRWLDDYEMGVPGDPTNDWKSLFSDEGINPKKMYPVAYVDQDDTATQAWLFWNKTDILVLAFPGTDILELQEDLDTSSDGAFVALGDMTAEKFDLTWKTNTSVSGAEVHAGYKKAYLSVRGALLETMHSITDWSNNWSILVTGHSLGGSLATLATFDIANREKEDAVKNKVQPTIAMFTIGAPAVANESLVQKFTDSVTYGFRVVSDCDPVARIMHHPFKRLGNKIPWDNTTTDSNDVTPSPGGQSRNIDTGPNTIWTSILTLPEAETDLHLFPEYIEYIGRQITVDTSS